MIVFAIKIHAQQICEISKIVHPSGNVTKIVVFENTLKVYSGNKKNINNLNVDKVVSLSPKNHEKLQKILAGIRRELPEAGVMLEDLDTNGVLDPTLWHLKIYNNKGEAVHFWEIKSPSEVEKMFKFFASLS